VGPMQDATTIRPWPFFEKAGTSHAYNPKGANFIERACADGNFMLGLLGQACHELKKLIEEHKVEAGSALAAVAVVGGAGTLLLPLQRLPPPPAPPGPLP